MDTNFDIKLNFSLLPWETIKRISDDGEACKYFNIGDIKPILLNNHILSEMKIIGFPANDYNDEEMPGLKLQMVDFFDKLGYWGFLGISDKDMYRKSVITAVEELINEYYSKIPKELADIIIKDEDRNSLPYVIDKMSGSTDLNDDTTRVGFFI